jgi:hypothetical protein
MMFEIVRIKEGANHEYEVCETVFECNLDGCSFERFRKEDPSESLPS